MPPAHNPHPPRCSHRKTVQASFNYLHLLRRTQHRSTVHLYEDLDREEMVFLIMFNTACIRSNILMLNCDHIDMLWNGKYQFPKDFRFESHHKSLSVWK
uniref:C2 tensin-type domain-containing protein n=1 Tax=Zea mays TaxID=4577 RepID=A0A804P0T5_MAIZE